MRVFICVAAFGQDCRLYPSCRVYLDTYRTSMPGAYLKLFEWSYRPRRGDGVGDFCRQHYGTDFEIVHFYAQSTSDQDANLYRVYLIPAIYAAIGAKAYKFFGELPEVLGQLYGNEGVLPEDIIYPEDYIAPSDLIGLAYVFKNWDGQLDYYQQWYPSLDSEEFIHFTINAEDIELWFTGIKTYVGPKTMEGWGRPYRAPTQSCYGRLEDLLRDLRQWAMH